MANVLTADQDMGLEQEELHSRNPCKYRPQILKANGKILPVRNILTTDTL